MRRKRVYRYYCEHCKKSNCSLPAMRKHERRCTMNPERECGMCMAAENYQISVRKLTSLLPNPNDYLIKTEWGDEFHANFDKALKPALEALRSKADNCPACILAAIRQAGIPGPAVRDFNFTAECKTFWNDINPSDHTGEYY